MFIEGMLMRYERLMKPFGSFNLIQRLFIFLCLQIVPSSSLSSLLHRFVHSTCSSSTHDPRVRPATLGPRPDFVNSKGNDAITPTTDHDRTNQSAPQLAATVP
jgi:hypothetical protein